MKKSFPLTAKKFQAVLLNWFDQHGRKDFPWQKKKTAYRVWVSEIMLQQTQVATVIPYYQRFMQRFPTVTSLANACEDDVLHLWTGLGYYTRARNLHRTAGIITKNFKGQFPATLDELQSLPGIGRSTAGAILASVFAKKAAILDGNVKRVLTRLAGIRQWPGEKTVSDKLWQLADMLTPLQRVADYNQAIMDMGATLCSRGKPLCEKCPFANVCVAHLSGQEKNIPQSKPKKTLPIRQKTFLLLQHDNHVLLEKRAARGIWGGLWSLPEMEDLCDEAAIKEFCRQQHFSIRRLHVAQMFRHTFSHFHLDILPVIVTLKSRPRKIIDSATQIWYNLLNQQNVGLPAPVKKLLEESI